MRGAPRFLCNILEPQTESGARSLAERLRIPRCASPTGFIGTVRAPSPFSLIAKKTRQTEAAEFSKGRAHTSFRVSHSLGGKPTHLLRRPLLGPLSPVTPLRGGTFVCPTLGETRATKGRPSREENRGRNHLVDCAASPTRQATAPIDRCGPLSRFFALAWESYSSR